MDGSYPHDEFVVRLATVHSGMFQSDFKVWYESVAISSLWSLNCSNLYSGILDGADANWVFCGGVGKQLSVQFVYIHKLVPFQWANS